MTLTVIVDWFVHRVQWINIWLR